MDKTVVMKVTDNVATCLADMRAGEEAVVKVDANTRSVTLKGDIPFGHKVALMDIAVGSKITKYETFTSFIKTVSSYTCTKTKCETRS